LKHITSILRPLREVRAVRSYGVLQSAFFIAAMLAVLRSTPLLLSEQ
jgi:hypothetical protein